ncbi:MAG TPA: sensor histidine kinase [Candidatus Acidoferrales bacterium]|nr:sensor histidine kinase [Candidatus Acidoferrales bacterium]
MTIKGLNIPVNEKPLLSEEPSRPAPMMQKIIRRVPIILALTVVYFAAGKLGLRLAIINPSASSVWPPTGIALAALLILGYDVWPAILIGAFAVNMTTTGSVATSLGIAAGNTLEALLGAYLVCTLAHGRRTFASAEDVLKFAFLGGAVSTTISATLGIASLSAAGFIAPGHRAEVWLTWWLGDLMGAIVVAPCIILWVDRPALKRSLRETVWGGIAAASLLLLGVVLFDNLLPFAFRDYRMAFLCIPLVVWGAFHLRAHEGATLVLALSGIAVWGTLRGFGSFAGSNVNSSLLLLQSFMGAIAMTSLVLSAAIFQRDSDHAALEKAKQELEGKVMQRTTQLQERIEKQKRAETALRDLSSRLLQMQDDERRRIARELHDSTGQELAWLNMSLSRLQTDMQADMQKLSVDTANRVAEALGVVSKVTSELRTMSYLLHPPLLDEMGLSSAIRWFVDGFVERSNIRVSVEIPAEMERFSPDLETAIFRVVQECLTNIHRHSGSATASIRLDRSPDGITLEVADQGKGIPEEKLPSSASAGRTGVGLRGMWERVRQFGGDMEISSRGTGTIVRVVLPVGTGGEVVPERSMGA